jgi:hypothetical protein
MQNKVGKFFHVMEYPMEDVVATLHTLNQKTLVNTQQ